MSRFWPLLLIVILLTACGDDDRDDPTPAIRLVSPETGYVWGDTFELRAECNAGDIDRVVFQLDNGYLATDSIAPYTCSWELTGVAFGAPHRLDARMIGIDGTETVSAPLTVRRMPFEFHDRYLDDFGGIVERDENGMPGSETDARDWQLFPIDSRDSRYASIAGVGLYSIGRTVHLSWTTNAELDNAGFRIRRSTIAGSEGYSHAILLNPEGLIPGAGTSNTSHAYAWEDSLSIDYDTTYYYWIETVSTADQITPNGPYACSVPDEVNWNTSFYPAYPNPATLRATLLFALDEPATVTVALVSPSLDYVAVPIDHAEYPPTGDNRLFWAVNELTPGIYRCVYFVEAVSGDYWGYGDIRVQ